MTLDEARKVAYLASGADGGCSSCVSGQVDELNRLFPEFEWNFDYDNDQPNPDWWVALGDNWSFVDVKPSMAFEISRLNGGVA